MKTFFFRIEFEISGKSKASQFVKCLFYYDLSLFLMISLISSLSSSLISKDAFSWAVLESIVSKFIA